MLAIIIPNKKVAKMLAIIIPNKKVAKNPITVEIITNTTARGKDSLKPNL
jgi:hypothetical protein